MNLRLVKALFLFVIAVNGLPTESAQAGMITNGTFSDTSGSPFVGWTTPISPFPAIGPPTAFVNPGDTDVKASFFVDAFNLIPPIPGVPAPDPPPIVTLYSDPFDLTNATKLSFEVQLITVLSIDGNSAEGDPLNAFAHDFFQAKLYKAPAPAPPNPPEPIVEINGLDPTFFSFSTGPDSFDNPLIASGVSLESVGTATKVSLDLTSTPSLSAIIEFSLQGQADGFFTTVLIDNVQIESADVIPEPASVAVWALLCAGGLPIVYQRRRKTAT